MSGVAGGNGGGTGGGGAPPPPPAVPAPPPVPPYVPPAAPVPNPYARPAVDPVYFACCGCLFAAGSGPVRANDLTLHLPQCRPQVVLPDPAAAAGLAVAAGGSGTTQDDDEANTNAIRCQACAKGKGKPCLPVCIHPPFACAMPLTGTDAENDDGRSFGSFAYCAVDEGVLGWRSSRLCS